MKNFGDRLYSVATINEPWCVAWLSHYLGVHAPGLKDIQRTARAMHYIMLAHGYGMEVIRSYSHKNAGIVLNKAAVESYSDKPQDIDAAHLYEEIHNSWFSDAVFNSKYPEKLLHLLHEHMPNEYEEDLKIIGTPIDWLGINYYTRNLIKFDGMDKTFQLTDVEGPLEKTDMNWEVYPEGLTKIIENEVKRYSIDIPIHITENGMANKDFHISGKVDDQKRIDYYFLHLQEVKTLIEKGYNIKSYFAWSLLDNFEWSFGYSKRFGLVYVDFESQKRIKKKSWYAFAENLN
jgi:beta-glucosidase